MPREKESYRDNLERLMDRFPGKEILSFSEVSQYTGMGYRALMGSGIPLKKTKGKHGQYFISLRNTATIRPHWMKHHSSKRSSQS